VNFEVDFIGGRKGLCIEIVRNVVPRCEYIAASPRGETACVRPIGHLSKTKYP